MTIYNKQASADIRRYIWDAIQQEEILNELDYYVENMPLPLVPIIPTQQVPEFNNLLPGKTYLIYDILQNGVGVNWWMSQETITFTIVSRDSTEILTISNLITDVFRRYDKTAKDINLQLSPTSPFIFRFFRLESSDPIQAFHDEGGFMSGIISVTYAYTRELNPDTDRYA